MHLEKRQNRQKLKSVELMLMQLGGGVDVKLDVVAPLFYICNWKDVDGLEIERQLLTNNH